MRWAPLMLLVACGGGDGPRELPDASPVASHGSAAGGFALDLRHAPARVPLNEPFEVRFVLRAPDGSPLELDPDQVRVDADMPEHGHGMNVVPGVTRDGPELVARPLEFMMPGRWEIYVDVTRGAITERARVEVTVE